MSRFLRATGWTLFGAVLALAAMVGGISWLYRDAAAPGPLVKARTVVVPARTSVAGVAALLGKEGIVRSPLAFEALARLTGRGGSLKPGEYEVPAAASAMDTLELLAGGRTVKHRLTVPEGLTSAEIIALIRDAPGLDGEVGTVPPDGSLLPDTYLYSFGERRAELIDRMRRAMAHAVKQLWEDRESDLPLSSPQEAVILASIIEKETGREQERPRIAAVFLNRLRLGMPLQADPTVLYAMQAENGTKPDRPLRQADLAIDSPYNTYRVKGLPPGAIANPGRAALRAAMQPERTADLYFVADGTGGHAFAKTLADHNRNVALYRRAMAAEGEKRPAVSPAVSVGTPDADSSPDPGPPPPKPAPPPAPAPLASDKAH
jgi:UPF0755 protein